jgi:hypothetical protein
MTAMDAITPSGRANGRMEIPLSALGRAARAKHPSLSHAMIRQAPPLLSGDLRSR